LPALRRDLLAFGAELVSRYGDAVMFRVGPQRIFLFAHPDYVEDVLVHRVGAFRKPPIFRRVFGGWIGAGIATSENDVWTRRHKLVQAALHRVSPHDEAEMVRRHVDRLVVRHAGERIDLSDALQRVSFSVITETVLGRVSPATCDALFNVAEFLQHAGLRKLNNPLAMPYFIPTPLNRQIARAVAAFDQQVRATLERWRGGQPGQTCDLVGALLAARDDQGQGLTDRQIRDEAVTMIFGGKETAGFSLVWTAYLLARHPHAQEKALREVDAVLGDRPPAPADLPRLNYLELVCKEAMRLYPPAYMMVRQATAATQIGPYAIPRGSLVLLYTYAIHRDPRWYDEPDAFRPERFESAAALPKYAYFPFGGGRRACVGSKLAMLESVLALAAILGSCRLRLPPEHQPPRLGTNVALHPIGPLEISLQVRPERTRHVLPLAEAGR
jgi:cytochrome P450